MVGQALITTLKKQKAWFRWPPPKDRVRWITFPDQSRGSEEKSQINVGGKRALSSAHATREVSGPHKRLVLGRDFARQIADLEVIVADLADRGDLGGGAGQPALFEGFQLIGHDVAFVNLDLHVA